MNTVFLKKLRPFHLAYRHKAKRYAAAKTNRLTGAWALVDSDINTLLLNSGKTIRARIRQLVRDFPYFARAVNVIVNFTATNLKLQAKTQDLKLNNQIEYVLNKWGDKASLDGRLSLEECSQLAKRTEVECGEFFLIKHYGVSGRIIPFAVQPIEPDRLSEYGKTKGKNEMYQGIEYDINTGIIRAYHFLENGYSRNTLRIPAERVIHGFKPLRVGQLRGISEFASGILAANDLHECIDSEITGAKLISRYLAFVTSSNMRTRQGQDITVEDDERLENIENATIKYLLPGETVAFPQSPRPNVNLPPFVRLILTMLSVSTGVPYELLSGDYQQLNYSVARTSRADFYFNIQPYINRHIQNFYKPIDEEVLWLSYLNNSIPINDFYLNENKYILDRITPEREGIDPLKESKADSQNILNLTDSPQNICKKKGIDFEDLKKQILEAESFMKELGGSLFKNKVNMNTHPTELGEENG